MISPTHTEKISERISSGAIHESKGLWVLGTYNGPIQVYRKGIEKPSTIIGCQGSVRSLEFNILGDKILSSDQNGNLFITDIETQAHSYTKMKAHSTPLECSRFISESVIVSGDSEGHVKVWDIRDSKTVQKFHNEKDFVSDIAVVDEKTFGVSTGNGVLSLYCTNRNKRKQYFHQEDDDLVSLCYDSFCSLFVAASSRPKLYSTRYPSLDFVCEANFKSTRPFVFVRAFKTNKCRVVVGADDGVVYITDVAPNHLIYAFQAHKNDLLGGCLSGGLVMTWSITNEYKVWDLSEKRDEEFVSEKKKKRMKKKKSVKVHDNRDSFFDELKDSDDE